MSAPSSKRRRLAPAAQGGDTRSTAGATPSDEPLRRKAAPRQKRGGICADPSAATEVPASRQPRRSNPPPSSGGAAPAPLPRQPPHTAAAPPPAPEALWRWSSEPTAESRGWVLLLGKPSNGRCRRLLECFRRAGPEWPALAVAAGTLACPERCRQPGGFDFHSLGACSPAPDCVIPLSKGRLIFRVIKELELHGIHTTNSSDSLNKTYDKWTQYRYLDDLMPRTVRVTSPEAAPDAAVQVARDSGSPYPVVVKATQGSGGELVFLCEGEADLTGRVAELLQGPRKCVILQQYIAESRGVDTRVYMVGGVPVASMRREASSAGEFKANLARGGKGCKHIPSPDEVRVAVQAAQRLGLGVAGVDLLRSQSGPLLCEVNANPGMRIQGITGVDCSEHIVRFARRTLAAHRAKQQRQQLQRGALDLGVIFSPQAVDRLRSPVLQSFRRAAAPAAP